MGVFDQKGNRFIRENLGSDNLPALIALIPNSTDNNSTTIPSEFNAIQFCSSINNSPRINPTSLMILNFGTTSEGYVQQDFNEPVALFGDGYITSFRGVNTALHGFSTISGSPDLRTSVTAADTSPITIYSSTVSGTRYEVKARILATSGSSATYTISWTEGGVAQKVALTITAVDTEVHDNFVIAPDANTNITAQITALTSSTVNVDAIVSVLG